MLGIQRHLIDVTICCYTPSLSLGSDYCGTQNKDQRRLFHGKNRRKLVFGVTVGVALGVPVAVAVAVAVGVTAPVADAVAVGVTVGCWG